jgi:hypothetical protein
LVVGKFVETNFADPGKNPRRLQAMDAAIVCKLYT